MMSQFLSFTNIFSDLYAEKLIQGLKSISKMLQLLHGAFKKPVNRQP